MSAPDAPATSPASPVRLRALIVDRARERAGHPFLELGQGDRSFSYQALDQAMTGWADLLDRRRIAARTPVLLLIADPIAFAAAYLAVVAAGRCALPLSADAPSAEVARAVSANRAVLAITDDRVRADGLDLPVVGISVETGGPIIDEIGTSGPVDLSARIGAVPARGAVRLATSGSSGAPKVVELDEQNLLHVAMAVADHHRLGHDDRGYCPLPLFHINAEVVGLLATLVAGATLVVDRRFHRQGFWAMLGRRRITWLNAVPAIYAILARDPIPPAPTALRFVRSASAPLPPALRLVVQEGLGVPLVESYGMTEAASQITATPLDGSAPLGSAGKPVAAELVLRAPTGDPVATGELGRVWIRGLGVIGAYAEGRAGERFDAQGWLDTGDLGRLDGDGFLFLTGRADDVINRGGELIHPREVQEVLLGDPRVADAVVVGRPDEILGESAVAFIRPVRPADADAAGATLIADLQARCRAELTPFKRPGAYEIVEELPRSATGKIQPHRLRPAGRST